ncbi:MFS transporter [Brenneria rubrifaciens]|uniref:MFS transporter n=1 Tax=Brenneria rubrifaciens TaxID=55213 RepID=A0A4P8QVG5_9GAMM|nr:MFS transporter [Brenneria rubrifaciens]QCR08165.1 MFS transporter [Brenneria rubrifaciens]
MQQSQEIKKVPGAVYILAIGIFAMVMSEFAVAGLMPQLAAGFNVTIAQIGYLVTVFAVAMAVGGPVFVFLLHRVPPKTSLLTILAVFLIGNIIATFASSYGVMVVARIVTGVASQAFFGVAISLCARLVDENIRGRAIGVAMNGLMLGTLLGLPAATLVGERFGWQSAFWAIAIATALAGILTMFFVHNPRSEGKTPEYPQSIKEQALVFMQPQLILALLSSTLIIGATFAAFSFFTPILTELSGFDLGTVPWLLLAYGTATVIGNSIVARLADRHTVVTLLGGTILNALFLTGLALWTQIAPVALIFMIAIGLVGVTMNPAMTIRVQRAGNASPLMNTVHSSFITLGIIISSAVGSSLIDHYGLRSTLILGVVMAILAILAILPAMANSYIRTGKNDRSLA